MLQRRKPLKAKKGLKRTAIKRKPPKPKPIKAKVKAKKLPAFRPALSIRYTPKVSFHNGSAAGRVHMGNVKRIGCVIRGCCRPAEAHHPLTMRRGSRASDFDTIALCYNHHSHQTPLGFGHSIHNGTRLFCETYGSEADLLEVTRSKLRMMGLPDGQAQSQTDQSGLPLVL